AVAAFVSPVTSFSLALMFAIASAWRMNARVAPMMTADETSPMATPHALPSLFAARSLLPAARSSLSRLSVARFAPLESTAMTRRAVSVIVSLDQGRTGSRSPTATSADSSRAAMPPGPATGPDREARTATRRSGPGLGGMGVGPALWGAVPRPSSQPAGAPAGACRQAAGRLVAFRFRATRRLRAASRRLAPEKTLGIRRETVDLLGDLRGLVEERG